MSNAILNICRPAQMQPTAKNVLMAIADRANDDGLAWPSIPGICEATCYSRTAVIAALRWLETAGLLSIAKAAGRNNRFTINVLQLAECGRQSSTRDGRVQQADQCATQTGAARAPVREANPTSTGDAPPPVRETDYTRPPGAPEPSITTIPTTNEPPSGGAPGRTRAKPRKQTKASFYLPDSVLPEWLAIDAWRDYTAMRDGMRKPMTQRAEELAIRKLGRWREEGHDPQEILEDSVMNGHQGLYAPKVVGSRKNVAAALDDPTPLWAREAGFDNRFEAANAGCHQHNAGQFRDGQHIREPA